MTNQTSAQPGICRECGCTTYNACWHHELGACAWTDPAIATLCTACVPDADPEWEHPNA